MLKAIRFKERIDNYDYILAFDIAKKQTGWALVETKTLYTCAFGKIVTDQESPWLDFFNGVNAVFNSMKIQYPDSKIFVTKERLPNQSGQYSTIATLQALAAAHAIFDLVCEQHEFPVYDDYGVHPTTVRAFFYMMTHIKAPTKKDVADTIVKMSGIAGRPGTDDCPYDVTDAAACAITLICKKWNVDLDTQIREVKRNQKKYR